MKKILFLTPDSFRHVNGGSVLFDELLKAFKKSAISWFICTETCEKTTLKYEFKSIENYNTPLFKLPILNTFARHFAFLGIPFFFLKYRLISNYCSKKAIRFIEKEKFDIIWIYAYHFAIPVARRIHEKLNIPLHLSIQDDIYTHLARCESKLLENDFKYLIENASSIDFVSKEMGEYYRQKYNLKAQSMTFMVSRKIKIDEPQISQRIEKIGYAGNIWCKENFGPLLEALEELEQKYSKLIKLFVYTNGTPSSYFSKFRKYILFSPVVEYEKLVRELQSCDLLYLPMTFMPDRKVTNITSFPSKLLTYMNAGIPILNHSPKEAISHSFVIGNNLGYSMNSMDKMEMINFFSDFHQELSISRRITYSKNAMIVLDKFDSKKMTNNFISLINGA